MISKLVNIVLANNEDKKLTWSIDLKKKKKRHLKRYAGQIYRVG